MKIFDNGDKGFYVKCTPDEKAKVIFWIENESNIKAYIDRLNNEAEFSIKTMDKLIEQNQELRNKLAPTA